MDYIGVCLWALEKYVHSALVCTTDVDLILLVDGVDEFFNILVNFLPRYSVNC